MKIKLLMASYIGMLLSIFLSLAFLFRSEFILSIFWLIISCISLYLFRKIVEDINEE
nr:MAG TPA: hypothetical protein [Caudoviricetes sp.]